MVVTMAITLASLLKNKEAISKEVSYNVERMNYAVRLPDSIKQQIIHMRGVQKMHIDHIGKELQISSATVRKVIIQAGLPAGNLNHNKD